MQHLWIYFCIVGFLCDAISHESKRARKLIVLFLREVRWADDVSFWPLIFNTISHFLF